MMKDEKFDISLYNDEFFEWHLKYAREYSMVTMDWLLEFGRPFQSVVDFGCGIGSYLESAFAKNITKIKGYDIGGDYAKKYTPEHIQPFIEYLDCTKPMVTEKYDCVISFETAEHIEPSGTNQFCDNLVNALGKDGYLFFTGAPEGQDGCGHINCQSKAFWTLKFLERNLQIDSVMTSIVALEWKRLGAPNYICDNLLIFKHDTYI
jgi:2-polyprenyl-3-methyl-5-hydroxy-6-metoxy-1,4-benzoquinol methylase